MKKYQALVICIGVVLSVIIYCCGNASNSSAVAVSMTNQNLFIPSDILVIPGQVVQWTNMDTVAHTVVADPGTTVGGPDSDLTHPNGIMAGGIYTWPVPSTATTGMIWYYHDRLNGTAGSGTSLGGGMAGIITVAAGF
ncbi:MAG: hypothetical protein WCQ53_06760 [bacterium]